MLTDKLIGIQQALKAPKSQTNTFGGYKYRSCEDILEAVKPLLAKGGVALTISDEIVEVGGRVYVKAKATLYDATSEADGHIDTVSVTAYAREEMEKKGMDASQITGAASSYARKYALNGLFCIDDTKDADFTNTGDTEPQKPAPKPAARAEYPPEPKAPKTASETLYGDDDDGPFCSGCGARISEKVRDYSVKKLGRALCMDCQKYYAR